MSDPDGLLTEEERAALRAGELGDEDRQALDGEVHYRVRRYAARGDVDAETAERIAADARLLDQQGHNGLVSMVECRLGEQVDL